MCRRDVSKRTSRNTGASNFGNGTRLDMTYNGQIGGPTGPTGPNGVARFMTYDYANRLVSAQLAGGLHALYTYDALSRRIQRDVAPPGPPIVFTTRFAYDGASVIEERDSRGTLQASFSPGSESFDSYRAVGDLPERLDGMETGSFSMRRGGQDYWLHADNTGTVFALSDASGAVVERYDYDIGCFLTRFALTLIVINEADAWLIAQPWPRNLSISETIR